MPDLRIGTECASPPALAHSATVGDASAGILDPNLALHAGEAQRTHAGDLASLHNVALSFQQAQAARFAHVQSARCVVCDAVLPRRFANGVQLLDSYPSCHAVACRMVVSRREEMGEASFRHYLQMQARHKQHLATVAQAVAARKLAEVEENTHGWSALRARLPAAPMLETLSLLLPSGPRRASRVAAKRRERYRAHLLQMIAEADGMAPASAPLASVAVNPAPASTMPGQLCALCGGGCCTRGGDQAYLSGATLRRFMDAQPALSQAQVVAAYLERVGVNSQAGSCINHSAQGCSLPREMRSDICNRFSCESLARLQAAQRGANAVQVVLIVRRKQDHWHRAEPALDNAVNAFALLRETGVRRFARAAPLMVALD